MKLLNSITAVVATLILFSCNKDEDAPAQPTLKADFTVNTITAFAPMKLQLQNRSQNADRIEWSTSFTGTVDTTGAPQYLIPRPGTYQVKLKAYKGNQVDSMVKQIVVNNNPSLMAMWLFSRNWRDSSGNENNISGGHRLLLYEADRKNNPLSAINLGDVGGALFLPDSIIIKTGTDISISM